MKDEPAAGSVAATRAPVFPVIEQQNLDDDAWSAFIAVASAPTATVGPALPRLLEGVTFGVKNNILSSGLPTRAASTAIDAPVTLRDAEVVSRLLDQGAICVGTLNMHELALGTTSANAFFGNVKNPRSMMSVAGGSSGGSAAAVAAGLVSFALSTDTGGSSRIPAAYCGVVGLRPTMGRYPSDGLISLAPSRDTAGVIASTVAQVALVDAAISGNATWEHMEARDLRLGVPRNGYFDQLEPAVADAMGSALALFADRGITLVETEVAGSHTASHAAFAVVAYEAPRAILALRGVTPVSTEFSATDVAELVDFIEEVSSADVREILEGFVYDPISKQEYLAALRVRDELAEAFSGTLLRADVSALVYPTVPITAPKLGERSVTIGGVLRPHFPLSIRNTDPGSFAGLPSVTIPLPTDSGASPIGLGIEGAAGRDRLTLGVAALLERILTEAPDRI